MIFDEDNIISKCQNGDAIAFSFIVEEYQQFVYNLALKMLNNVGDAEDLVQDVFVKVWNSIKFYSADKSKFSTWLFSIISRTCLDQLRKRKSIVTISEGQLSEYHNIQQIVVDKPEDRDAIQLIKTLSDLLTPTQKLVFVLRDLEGYEVSEVVTVSGLTEKQIKDNLYLARKSIKAKMRNCLSQQRKHIRLFTEQLIPCNVRILELVMNRSFVGFTHFTFNKDSSLIVGKSKDDMKNIDTKLGEKIEDLLLLRFMLIKHP